MVDLVSRKVLPTDASVKSVTMEIDVNVRVTFAICFNAKSVCSCTITLCLPNELRNWE